MAWTVDFLNLSNKAVHIEIGGTDETVSLTPARDPLTIDEDDDDDVFTPVRTSSGNIKVITTYDVVEAIMPSYPLERPVTITVDGTTEFVGFLQCSSYKQELFDLNADVDLPIISPLEALDGVPLSQTEYSDSLYANLARLLYLANTAVGGVWESFYFPSLSMPDTTLYYMFDRRNWFEFLELDEREEDSKYYEAKSYKEVLEDVCKVFGWQLHERGASLYFLMDDHSETSLLSYTATQIYNIATGTTGVTGTSVTAATAALDTFSFADDTNKLSYIQGKRSVKVTGKVNQPDDTVLEMDIKNHCSYIATDYAGSVYIHTFGPGEGHAYNLASSGLEYGDSIEAKNYDDGEGTYYGGNYEESAYTGDGEYSYSYRAVIGKNVNGSSNVTAIRIYSVKKVFVPNDMELMLEVKRTTQWKSTSSADWTNDTTMSFPVVLRFGDYYYGQQSSSSWGWGTTRVVHTMSTGASDSYDESDYNAGILLPSGVEGEFEMTFLSGYSSSVPNYVSIDDLSLVFHKRRSLAYCKDDTDENVARARNSYGFTEDYSIEMELTCARDTQYGCGVILDSSMNRVATLSTDGGYPEDELCTRASNYYSSSKSRLDVVVSADAKISDAEYITYNNKTFAILAQSMNYRDCELTLSLQEIAS